MQIKTFKFSLLPLMFFTFFIFCLEARANHDYVCYESQTECSSNCTWTSWDINTHTRKCIGTSQRITHWGNTRVGCVEENNAYNNAGGLRSGKEIVETKSCIIISQEDKIPPTVTWTPSSPNWINLNQEFKAKCTDNLSGCEQVNYTCTVSVNGGKCTITAKDKAGNSQVYTSPAAKIDKNPPTCGTKYFIGKSGARIEEGNQLWTNDSPLTPYVNCNDLAPGSACKQAAYNGILLINNNDKDTNIIIQDNASNISVCTSAVAHIDRLPPSCVISGGTGEGGRFLIGNSIQATCSDTASDANNGISGCQANPAPVVITNPPQTSVSLSVKDVAGNTKDCSQYGDGNIIDEIRLQYVEIRGLSETKTTTSTRTEVANLIKQNVANLTRNQTPNSSNNTLNWNLNNSTIAYYVGDVTLGASFTISGKKTIIIQDGSLTLNGEITYTDTNSILGIIVLGTGTKGNVTIGANVKNIAAVLFAEGTLFSADQNNENQLYWKGTVISDNTIGGYNSSPQKCPQKISSCDTANALAGDLNYFRSYYQATTSGQPANDPLGKHAPFIIEYDNSLTTKTPYGFEASSDVSFQEIAR